MVLEYRAGRAPSPSTAGDYFATFEWGAGGMTHLHALLWMPHSPRIDLAAKGEKAKEADPNGDLALSPEFDDAVSDYFENFVAEIHPLKQETGDENKVSANRKSRKGDCEASGDPCATAWAGLCRLLGPGSDDSEAAFDERVHMIGQLADFSNMHDWREPYPGGPPLKVSGVREIREGYPRYGQRTYLLRGIFSPGARIARE